MMEEMRHCCHAAAEYLWIARLPLADTPNSSLYLFLIHMQADSNTAFYLMIITVPFHDFLRSVMLRKYT